MTTVAQNERAVDMTPAWDPWPRFANWFDNLFPGDSSLMGRYTHTIRIEEFMRGDDYVIRAELPGIDPDKNVDIEVHEGVLRITASRQESTESEQHSEFRYGRFVRTIVLPRDVDSSDVKATYRDGILEVVVKMPPVTAETRHVPVKRAS